MSNKHLRICLACWLSIITVMQFAAIAYLLGYFNLKPIEKFLNKCGEDYFFSRVIVDKDEYYFSDVDGCDKNNSDILTCVYSVKNSGYNNYYEKKHKVDSLTKMFLNEFHDNEIIKIENLFLLNKYPTINELMNSTIKKIKLAWFKVKRIDGRINEIILITSSKPKKYCNESVESIMGDI